MSHDVLAHGRAILGARALHAAGHISASKRDKIVKHSKGAIASMGESTKTIAKNK